MQAFKLEASSHSEETLLFTVNPSYGNLNSQQQPRILLINYGGPCSIPCPVRGLNLCRCPSGQRVAWRPKGRLLEGLWPAFQRTWTLNKGDSRGQNTKLQREPHAYPEYMALLPSILIVASISKPLFKGT